MTETPPAPGERTRAEHVRTRWPGLVWAIPLAALIVVGFLGLRAFFNRGVDVVVAFSSAGEAKVDDTQVEFKGAEVGHVAKIALDPDGRRVDLTLRLQPEVKRDLRAGTVFWMIGAKPSLTDLSSLKAAVAGLSIGMAAGTGAPQRRFDGLDEPPPVMPGAKGRSYRLTADSLADVKTGQGIFYQGLEIGKVITQRFTPPHRFEFEVFVEAPYDSLVRPGSQFWNGAGVNLAFNAQGLQTSVAPSEVFGGGLDLGTPDEAFALPPAPQGTAFPLYASRTDADLGPEGPKIAYAAQFAGDAGEVQDGAAVTLRGFKVGEVFRREMRFDGATGQIATSLVLDIAPLRLHLTGPAPASGDWRGQTDRALNALVQRGYRLRIVQDPPLVGSYGLEFVPAKGAPPAALKTGGDYTLIPSADGGDASDLAARADSILAKVDNLPIAAIGRDVSQITARLRTLVASPQLTDSLNHLDHSLASVDRMTAEAEPQVGPLIVKLRQTADEASDTVHAAGALLGAHGGGGGADLPEAIHELTNAARSINALADYLQRHPEALVKGKGSPK